MGSSSDPAAHSQLPCAYHPPAPIGAPIVKDPLHRCTSEPQGMVPRKWPEPPVTAALTAPPASVRSLHPHIISDSPAVSTLPGIRSGPGGGRKAVERIAIDGSGMPPRRAVSAGPNAASTGGVLHTVPTEIPP